MRKIQEAQRKAVRNPVTEERGALVPGVWGTIVSVLLLHLLIIYPLVQTVLGVDLNDTGFHLYHMEYIFSRPGDTGMSTFLTDVVGHVWMRLFPGLGLWGLNLLEVLFEYILCFVVWKLLKPYVYREFILGGLVIASVSSHTYFEIFNFHQFHVFWLVMIVCCIFRAIIGQQYRYTFLAGLCLVIDVSVRIASATSCALFLVYIIWYCYRPAYFQKKKFFGHVLYGILGVVLGLFVIAVLLWASGLLPALLDNLLRVSAMADDSAGTYRISTLISIFLRALFSSFMLGQFYAIICALIIAGCYVFYNGLMRTKKLYFSKAGSRRSLESAVSLLGASAFFVLAFVCYKIQRNYVVSVPNWPQMTFAHFFVPGVLLFLGFLALVIQVFVNVRKFDLRSEQQTLLMGLAMLVPIFTTAGSNTGVKHALLAYWILIPVLVQLLYQDLVASDFWLGFLKVFRSKGDYPPKLRGLAMALCGLVFLRVFVILPLHVNNFDEPRWRSMSYSIRHPKLRFLRTTERRARYVEGVLAQFLPFENGAFQPQPSQRPLMVIGSALAFNYLLDRPGFGSFWPLAPGVSIEKLRGILLDKYYSEEELPDIILCMTDTSWGFEERLFYRGQERRRNIFSVQKQIDITTFLDRYAYGVSYVSDYFAILRPGLKGQDFQGRNYLDLLPPY